MSIDRPCRACGPFLKSLNGKTASGKRLNINSALR
jgi:hypothetical protein